MLCEEPPPARRMLPGGVFWRDNGPMSDTPKSLYMQRTGVREYVARNQDGAEILVGHGPGRFSPGDLLKLAIAGCKAMSSDARMAARLGDDFDQFVGVSADYDQEHDRFTHVDVELVQDMSALSDEEIADLERRANAAIERNCTIAHSVVDQALPASHAWTNERID